MAMLNRLTSIEERYDEIDNLMADPEVSVDFTRIQTLAKEQATLRNIVQLSRELRRIMQQVEETTSIIHEESDAEMLAFAKEEVAELEKRKTKVEENLQVALVPKDPNDDKNVIMEIRAGAGGDEAGLFASEVFRMYQRYAENRKWKLKILSQNDTGVGGLKEVTFELQGERAYQRLHLESGVHRVQRVPATESQGRIHTSTTTVAVLPKAEELDVQINDNDLKIDVFHSGGAGGQNVNKVATAIRITHLPSGLVVQCQNERSQLQNKLQGMEILRSRLWDMELRKRDEAISANRKAQVGTGDRSEKIRTYNFPQSRITDHRIGYTSHQMQNVLSGELDEFIDALLQEEQARKLATVNS